METSLRTYGASHPLITLLLFKLYLNLLNQQSRTPEMSEFLHGSALRKRGRAQHNNAHNILKTYIYTLNKGNRNIVNDVCKS